MGLASKLSKHRARVGQTKVAASRLPAPIAIAPRKAVWTLDPSGHCCNGLALFV